MLTACITHFGWRNTLRILSGWTLVLGVACGSLLTDPPTEGKATTSPAESSDPKQDETRVKDEEAQDDRCQDTNGDPGSALGDDDAIVEKGRDRRDLSHEPRVQDASYCLRVIRIMKNLPPWVWSLGNMFGFLGWTFFTIYFVSGQLM